MATMLLALLNSLAVDAPTLCDSLPDMTSVAADIAVPPLTAAPPRPGQRSIVRLPGVWAAREAYIVLYLPPAPISAARFPVVVELPGNGHYHDHDGDVCTGRPENCTLGYGLTGGADAVWASVPFLLDNYSLAITWWGDAPRYSPHTTAELLQATVSLLTENYGGDAARVTLAGFSRGAIGAWYVGLYDDTVAQLWSSFLVYAHCYGEYPVPFAPDNAPANVTRLLSRLRGRPSFVNNCDVSDERARVTALCPPAPSDACDGLRWSDTPFRNHNDQWALRPTAERTALRAWFAGL